MVLNVIHTDEAIIQSAHRDHTIAHTNKHQLVTKYSWTYKPHSTLLTNAPNVQATNKHTYTQKKKKIQRGEPGEKWGGLLV